MTYLAAAVVVLAVLGLLNIVLTLGILRRLRTAAAADSAGQGLLVGARPGSFATRTLHGQPITEAVVTGGSTLIGFFSPGCAPCIAQAPGFVARAGDWPGGPQRVLVVIADDTPEAAVFAEQFEQVARVVIDGLQGPVASAYGVDAFPSFGVLDEAGVVVAETTQASQLPAPASV